MTANDFEMGKKLTLTMDGRTFEIELANFHHVEMITREIDKCLVLQGRSRMKEIA